MQPAPGYARKYPEMAANDYEPLAEVSVKPWPKRFHNLRAGGQNEPTGSFPLASAAE